MKHVIIALLSMATLSGCGLYSTNQTPSEEIAEKQEKQTDVVFNLQKSNEFAKSSPLNDETLKLLSDRVVEGNKEAMGVDGELSLTFSGVYLEAENNIYGVYLLTNRTDDDMTNIRFDMMMKATETDSAPIIAKQIYLGSEAFGTLASDTAMPVYVEMSADKKQAIDMFEFGQAIVTIDNIHYEKPDGVNSEDDQMPEGFTPGYHPQYTLSVRHEEQLRKDIAEGNVPQLELIVPPTIQNNPQAGEIIALLNDEVLNPARGLSVESEMTLYWTGVTAKESNGSISTLFLIANRTGKDMTDFSVTMNFKTSGGDDILDNHQLTLSSSEYGTLPTNSVMPVFVTIPANKQPILDHILEGEVSPQYSIESYQ